MKKQTRIGVGDALSTSKGFVNAWKRAEKGQESGVEEWLHFESLETLLKILTPGRWVLLKALRASGPMSIRALAGTMGRDYKNVHTDVRRLEEVGLIVTTAGDQVHVPWDIVEARLRLAA
jgi:predicted transcriptional regulator